MNEILGGLEGSFDAVQSTTGVAVEPDQVAAVMRDLFTEHAIPARSRERIITELADAGEDMTVYDVLQRDHGRRQRCRREPGRHRADAAPRRACRARDSNDRCGECRRILPGGFSAN